MLLFKVGLLTLINIDPLIFLVKLCPSLPILQADSEVSQASGASPLNNATSQATSSTGSQEAVALPPVSNNITQAGSSSGRSFPRGNRHSARLRASQASQGEMLLPRQIVLPPGWQ